MTKHARGLVALLFSLLLVSGCGGGLSSVRLTVTTGNAGAVYNQLGIALAQSWASELRIPQPKVLTSAGSVQNLDLLLNKQADVAISQIDVAAVRFRQPGGQHLRALARMHDDYIQVVVPANSPVQSLTQLRGQRVSVGSTDSGVQLITDRLLTSAGLPANSVDRESLSLDQSVDALEHGQIAAFFWSGGIPTAQITALARQMPIRILDLSSIVPAINTKYPEYRTGIIPTSAYGLPHPVTTLMIPNVLLVTDRMSNNVAEALTRGVFAAQPKLAAINHAARSIDVRSGIETMPIPLHPGAVNYYRSAEGTGP
jgi:TRAP transporter TAXI family solute receptor